MDHPRRYAKACDACHKKKIRCVYAHPACQLCRKTGQQCKFTRIEKATPSRPRREKYFAALEQRLINMEGLLQEARSNKPAEASEPPQPPLAPSVYDQELKALNSQDPIMRSEDKEHDSELQLPPKQQAMRLAVGYFLTFNHYYPIFSKERFFRHIEHDYPPDREMDPTWWNTVVVVLCFAHRLRAMSTPGQADAENEEACRYLKVALDAAPKVTYDQPSLENAQVLLGVAATLQGTKISHPSSMLIAAAIRMLQQLNAHHLGSPGNKESDERKERERAFWVAYILDKDDSFRTGSPPLLPARHSRHSVISATSEDGIGVTQSLDSNLEVNLFEVSATLALIQNQVCSRIISVDVETNIDSLQTARDDLNTALATWKSGLPFGFNREDLVGRWPKPAIVHIVVLHFRYFQTLVEINKVPPMEEGEMLGLGDDCPVAKMLSVYSHSSDPVTVDAARNALDLASLTPRGNFQIIWLFFNFSISAVLTLLVNGIIRPFDDNVTLDLQRVDVWLRVIDKLARDSDRLDLLEKRDFLSRMQQWTSRVVQEAIAGLRSSDLTSMRCIKGLTGSQDRAVEQDQFVDDFTIWDASWIPELDNYQAGGFPDDVLMSDNTWIDWTSMNDIGMNVL